jgi:hypothetical protein
MHGEQNFLSRSWKAYLSLIEESDVSPVALPAKNKLTARKLLVGGFSKDGAQVCGTTGEGAEWQLYAIDVKTCAEKMLAPLDLPASTDSVAGFSLHPGGNRFLKSIAKWPYNIWMLEGFDQMPRKTWLDLDSTPSTGTW